MKTKANRLYDFVSSMADRRLPQFNGSGIKREGAQVHFGRGKGMFFLAQTLYLHKFNGHSVVIRNTATAATRF